MPSRKQKTPPTPPDVAEGPQPLRPAMPVRLLPHDWPFLYSVLPHGDLVMNKRLPPAPAARRSRGQVIEDAGEAPF